MRPIGALRTVRMTDDLWNDIAEIAERYDITMSEAVRQILAHAVETKSYPHLVPEHRAKLKGNLRNGE